MALLRGSIGFASVWRIGFDALDLYTALRWATVRYREQARFPPTASLCSECEHWVGWRALGCRWHGVVPYHRAQRGRVRRTSGWEYMYILGVIHAERASQAALSLILIRTRGLNARGDLLRAVWWRVEIIVYCHAGQRVNAQVCGGRVSRWLGIVQWAAKRCSKSNVYILTGRFGWSWKIACCHAAFSPLLVRGKEGWLCVNYVARSPCLKSKEARSHFVYFVRLCRLGCETRAVAIWYVNGWW